MRQYVLDTNVYVAADRDLRAAADLSAFARVALSRTFLHAVVAQELLAGAIGTERRDALHDAVIRPFDHRRRLVTPSFRAWSRAGQVIAELVEARALSRDGFTRSFVNDVVLATSCRENGLTLVTWNVADFARIQRVFEFDFVPPWPAA